MLHIFFPVRKRHLITTKVTEKGKNPVTQSWFWQLQCWQHFLKAEWFASRRKHGQQHCCRTAVLTGYSKGVLVPVELAQFIFLCQWEIIFAQERQSHSISILLAKIISDSDAASFSILQWRKHMVCILPFVGQKVFVQFVERSGHGLTMAPSCGAECPGAGEEICRDVLNPASTAAEEGREGGVGGPQQDPQPFLILIHKGVKPSPAGPYTSVSDVFFCPTEIDGPRKGEPGLAQPGEKVLSTALWSTLAYLMTSFSYFMKWHWFSKHINPCKFEQEV